MRIEVFWWIGTLFSFFVGIPLSIFNVIIITNPILLIFAWIGLIMSFFSVPAIIMLLKLYMNKENENDVRIN